MATYHLTAPDGSAYEVDAPDNAKPQDVYAVLNAHLGKQKASPQQDNLSPLDREMDTQVEAEAKKGYTPGLSFAAGTPFGSWKDELSALMESGMHKLTGSDAFYPYDKAKAYENARQRYRDKEHPIAQTAASIAGGLASAPYLPFLKFAKGGGLGADIVNGMANGWTAGALYGLGDDSGKGRGQNMVDSSIQGLEIGGALAPVFRGAGAAFSALAGKTKPLPQELRGYHPEAVNTMADLVQADGLMNANGLPNVAAPGYFVSKMAAKERALGPEGMIADMGPSMRGIAAGMAKRPGSEEMSTVVNALEARDKGAMGRLERATNNAMEAPVNVEQTLEDMKAQAARMAKPWYDQFRSTPIKLSENMYKIMDRANAIFTPQEGGLFPQVQQILRQEGLDPNMARNNGLMIDGIKKAIDAKISAAKNAGDNDAVRRFTSIASDLRNETDAILRSQGAYARDASGKIIRNSKGVGKSIYEHARDVSGEHIRVRQAFEDGQDAFKKGFTVDQMGAAMKKMTDAEKFFYRLGARGQIREMVDNAATRWGPNGDATQAALMHTPAGKAKVSMLSRDPASAGRLLKTVEQETEFAKTSQPALKNSVTATAQAAQARIPGAVEKQNIKLGATAPGIAITAAEKVINHVTNNAVTERNIKIAVDMAKMAVAQGADRRAIAEGLFKVVRSRGVTAQQRTALTRVANKLLYAGVPSYIDARSRAAAPTP